MRQPDVVDQEALEADKVLKLRTRDASPTATRLEKPGKGMNAWKALEGRILKVTANEEGDGTMEGHEVDNLVGMYEEDKSIKCRECMKAKDWKDLKQENIITLQDVENGEKLFYCDYCEEKL